MTDPVTVERCEHGIRHPHHCDDCLDRDIPPGKSITEHPCYGLPLNPTGMSHRNSWPLSQKEHPYCSRCGTEIEGVNNRQKDGAPLCWEPRPTRASPSREPREEQSLEDARVQDICLALLEGYQTGWQAGMAGEKAKLSEVWMTSDARAKVNGAALTLPEQPRPVDDVETIIDKAIEDYPYGIHPDWAKDAVRGVARLVAAALGHKDRGGE